MTLRDHLGSSPILLEMVPPPTRGAKRHLRERIKWLQRISAEAPIDGVNIPEIRRERSKDPRGVRRSEFVTRLDPRIMGKQIQEELGIEVIVNRVVVHAHWRNQQTWLIRTYHEYGIRNLVLVGGEDPDVHYRGPTVADANRLVRDHLNLGRELRDAADGPRISQTDYLIGNITIPSRRNLIPDEPERIDYKVKSGASFLTSQIVYHAEEMTTLLDDLEARVPESAATPIFISICPIRRAANADFLRWLGVKIEDALVEQLARDPEKLLQRSIEYLVEMWEQIRSHVEARRLRTPLGLNIAPVGPLPDEAVLELIRRLRG